MRAKQGDPDIGVQQSVPAADAAGTGDQRSGTGSHAPHRDDGPGYGNLAASCCAFDLAFAPVVSKLYSGRYKG